MPDRVPPPSRPRLLWTTTPEKLPIRKPDVVATCANEHTVRGLIALHPHLTDLPLYNFGETKGAAAMAFQPPGEGPWRVFPGDRGWVHYVETADSQARMDQAIVTAFRLGSFLRAKNPNVVAWEVGGGFAGCIAVGLARALGRAVCVAPGSPDRLAIAFADRHGVELRVIANSADQRKALAYLRGF